MDIQFVYRRFEAFVQSFDALLKHFRVDDDPECTNDRPKARPRKFSEVVRVGTLTQLTLTSASTIYTVSLPVRYNRLTVWFADSSGSATAGFVAFDDEQKIDGAAWNASGGVKVPTGGSLTHQIFPGVPYGRQPSALHVCGGTASDVAYIQVE